MTDCSGSLTKKGGDKTEKEEGGEKQLEKKEREVV